MAVWTGNRFRLSQAALVAVGEVKLAARVAPRVVRYLAPIVAWAIASIFLGLIVGLAAVFLPPLGAFGIVAIAAVVLLWVMPDLPLVWPSLIRKTFFVMLIADLCVPNYYAVQFGGLPWISARRIATFALIAPFLIAIAASSDARRRIAERLGASSLIVICVAGYLFMAILSLFTSPTPSESMTALVEALLSWYVPFFAMIYIVRDHDDAVFILKVICCCALFITAVGLMEFFEHRNIFVDIFPHGMLSSSSTTIRTSRRFCPATSITSEMVYIAQSWLSSLRSLSESLKSLSSRLACSSPCTGGAHLRRALVGQPYLAES